MRNLTLLLSVLFMSAFTSAFSQEAPLPPPAPGQAPATGAMQHVRKTPEERADEHAARLKAQLLLTGEQYDQVRAIDLDIAKKRESSKIKGNREANMAMMQNLETERQNRIMSVLNDPQKAKYQKMIAAEKARMQERMKQHTPPPPPQGDAPNHQ